MPYDGSSTHDCQPYTNGASYTDDTITEHPLWMLQVQAEREMLELGADNFREVVAKARAKGQMTNLRPVRKLLDTSIPDVAKGIRNWRTHSEKMRGVKPLAYLYIKDEDPELLALIALRVVLDSIGTRRARAVSLSRHIGARVEHELQCRLWLQADPGSFRNAQHYFDTQGSTPSHRAKANIVLFNRQLAEGKLNGATWAPWPWEAQFRVGVTLIEILVRHTGLFGIEHDLEYRPASERKQAYPLIVAPKAGVLEWLGSEIDRDEYSRPFFMPTVIEPRPWDSTTSGGYWTPLVRSPRLISFHASHEDQRGQARQEYAALDMPQVYQATNRLQNVPWRIDRKLLKIAESAWAIDMGIGHLPVLTEQPMPPRPEDFEDNEEARKEWRREAHPIKRANRTLYGRTKLTKSVFSAAQRYSEYERFFFPHNLDFRGRAYSIPSGLSPQGGDLARGLLKFADAKPVSSSNGGDRWLALHLAGMMGHDKCSNEDRIEWVRSQRDRWLSIANEPLLHANEWRLGPVAKGSKSWRALAAIIEWAGYLQEGDGFMSDLPCHVDGTCNGLQHLSAMIRDHEGGALVNLTPGDLPSDIYGVVAEDLQAALEWMMASPEDFTVKDREGKVTGNYNTAQLSASYLDWLGGSIGRSSTKRPVMVIPYGGSRDAFMTYTRAYLDEVHPLSGTALKQDRSYRTAVLSLVVRHLWAICNKRLHKSMAVMRWLQECARIVAEGNQPIYWTVPSGFVVRHFYGQLKERRLKVTLDGTMHSLSAPERTKKLDIKAQCQGVPPNFVHSLDAAAMMLTVNGCQGRGITHLTAIHDAYGSHAGDMDNLASLIREAFVQVHEHDVLGGFWEGCADILETVYQARGLSAHDAREAAERQRPALPPRGALELSQVLHSPYFFS